MGHDRERSCSALLLSQEVLPDVLAVLLVGATVGNGLPRDGVMCHVRIHNHDGLTHCLSILNVGKLAAHVETCVDDLGSSPRSSDRWGSALDQH